MHHDVVRLAQCGTRDSTISTADGGVAMVQSSEREKKSRQTFHDLSSDSGEEYGVHRERIPTLQPGQFDGSTSWREFLSRFEDCARANHWSERTMTVQMRFCLVGATGAVIHKNPRSGRWDYARIVEEVEAAYGPSSEHAAAIGIELRQRVRKADELLHVLRDDIYEKVSIVYAARSEREQDSISVEVFTNAMGDAEIVQWLLKERPCTLARTYEIAHRLYNPGNIAVKVKRGVIAGVLQPADVVRATNPEILPADPLPAVVPSHLESLYAESTKELEETEWHKLAELLSAYSDVFSTGPTDLGRTNMVQHDIQTRPGPPVKQPPHRMASGKQQSADEQIQQNPNAGLASQSNSSWASSIVMVQKKDQTYRLCVNYRVLNERTIKDAYPLPRIQDTLNTLSTAKWFSTLDLASGYWQVELTPGARQTAAFCSRKGLFEWNMMPFGL
ncbi:hypothetical protein QTP70_016720 [Hemibagrus guttatus]|uniref:ribonuclease H n=1 Tax=Hemibagrus guttatus TaxID=175788 RepID=A0AAE0R6B7_9TELE|nr:hypothetical protein QTP70_016720 [Hemibagrus guttatus]